MSVSDIYPRLLIIASNAFNPLSGGGIMFTNLFKDWPKDKMACIYEDKIEPTTDVCDHYYLLSQKEFRWAFPFSLLSFFRSRQNGRAAASGGFPKITGFAHSLVSAARVLIGGEIPTKVVFPKELERWISDFKPDVIYTILGSLPYIRLVYKIAKKFNLPVVIHVMDDWPDVRYNGILDFYRRQQMDKELREIIKESAACLSICDAMSEAYKKRYGRPFPAFANALPADEWISKARKNWNAKPPFKILYAGALMVDSQLGSVRDVCDAVARLRSQGFDIKFDIYAPWYAARRFRNMLERPGCVSVSDAPEKMDIEEMFASADLLVLPVNFDKKSVKYIKYSMPNKVPAYMFSGTPTLAYGPAEVASIKYAQKWAHCVTEKNIEKLCAAIKLLASDEKLRGRLAKNAQNLACEKHDQSKVKADFHQVLIDAARK